MDGKSIVNISSVEIIILFLKNTHYKNDNSVYLRFLSQSKDTLHQIRNANCPYVYVNVRLSVWPCIELELVQSVALPSPQDN